MEKLLVYMVQTTVCTGLFWWIYGRIIESRTGYDQARFYLLSAVLVSAVIPLLEIPVFPGKTIVVSAMPFGAVAEPVRAAAPVAGPSLNWAEYLYAGILLVFVFQILCRLCALYRLVKRGRVARGDSETGDDSVKIVRHPDISVPFSFFHYIFLPEHISEEQKRAVLLHEQSHMRHAHSVDRILLETLQGIMWYNPFVRLIRRKVVEIHEFQADRDVLDSGVELSAYRELLLQQTMGSGKHIVNNLHQSFIKKRFIMMTKFQKSKYALLRIGTAVPATAVLMLCFSFVEKDAVIVSESKGQAVDTTMTTDKGTFNVRISTDSDGEKIYEVRAADNNVATVTVEEVETVAVDTVITTDRGTFKVKMSMDSKGEKIYEMRSAYVADTLNVGKSKVWIVGRNMSEPDTSKKNVASYVKIDSVPIITTAVSSAKKDSVLVVGKAMFFKDLGNVKKQPDDTTSVKLFFRAENSEVEPLVIVDDKKAESKIIAELNPENIESFSVLKDSAAIRTYGEEGKNGVLIIRTKKRAGQQSSDGE